jgi:hypothetical protein
MEHWVHGISSYCRKGSDKSIFFETSRHVASFLVILWYLFYDAFSVTRLYSVDDIVTRV